MSRAEKRANENEARAAALHWLQLLDTGDYEEAFEFEAQDFRMSRTQSQFVRLMQARRAPFGNALSRNFIGAAHVEKLNPTAERVILIKQPIGWRVIDYRIY